MLEVDALLPPVFTFLSCNLSPATNCHYSYFICSCSKTLLYCIDATGALIMAVSDSIFLMLSTFFFRFSCSSTLGWGICSGMYRSGINILLGVLRMLSMVSSLYFSSLLLSVDRTKSGASILCLKARSMSKSSLALRPSRLPSITKLSCGAVWCLLCSFGTARRCP